VDFGKLFKAIDGITTLVDSIRGPAEEPRPEAQLTETPPVGLSEQLQAGLTNVVVAALKEAFDRDRARLEMERTHLEEQRLRAEANMRIEMRRQAAEREAGRLKLLGGAALVGWVVSVALMLSRIGHISTVSQILIGLGSLFLLSSLGCAFYAYGQIPDPAATEAPKTSNPTAAAALWLLLGGLALTAVSLLV
jgi:hypothetical protein